MKKLCLCLMTAVAFGCGSSNNNTGDPPDTVDVPADVQQAYPDMNTVGINTDDNGTSISQATNELGELPLVAEQGTVQQGLDSCHPHLFARTAEVVLLFDRHFYKGIRHLVSIVAARATRQTNNPVVYTWIRTRTFGGAAGADGGTGASVQLTIKVMLTKNSDTSWDAEMDWKKASDPDTAYVKVFGAHLDSVAGQPRQGKGTMTINLTAMALNPAEKATGTINVTFKNTGNNRYVQGQLQNILWDNAPAGTPPINANFVHAAIKGVGGCNKFQDQLKLWCPANPNNLTANLNSVSRWKASGKGRSDTKATGGQFPAGNSWLGTTCHTFTPGTPVAEAFWQIKQVDANGNIVFLDAVGNPPSGACDPDFGPIPAPAGPGPDYNFAALNMTDGSVCPFPGSAGVTFYP